jgi:imidazolonepropionase
MLACGTTTSRSRSGYGLTVESELKILRAIATLASDHPIEIAATFSRRPRGAAEFRARRDAYVNLVVEQMIPAVAAEKARRVVRRVLRDGCLYSDESARILEGRLCAPASNPASTPTSWAQRRRSLVAARVRARPADHLIHVAA